MVGFAEIGLRSDAGTGDSPKSTDDSLTDSLRIPRARSKKGSAHAETLFVVAEAGSCADASRGVSAVGNDYEFECICEGTSSQEAI